MKKLSILLILLLALTSCGYRPIFRTFSTVDVNRSLDSLFLEYRLPRRDTVDWMKIDYRTNDGVKVRNYVELIEVKNQRFITTIKAYPDSNYIINFRREYE